MGLNLLLIGDDAADTVALTGALQRIGHRVVHVGDAREALAIIGSDGFDAMLLERSAPRLDGLSFVETLRASGVTLPVVMLSALARPRDRVEGLDAGADDYLALPVDPAELDARVRAILRGRRWTAAPADTIRVGDIVVAPTSFRAWRGGKPIALPRLEFALLAELARHADQVLTRATLIERVWGYAAAPATNIVDVHIRRLRLKLAGDGSDDPIVTLRGVGYMLRS